MSMSSRFSDPQYVNWLRCASSLVILKESLHDYIEAGVRRLHDNVKHSVTTQLGAQLQCSDCSWKGIRQKNPKGTWSVKCSNNICNIWLGEILSKHDDPQSRTINWGNADMTKWSTEPWEIAKIFMTNGQRNKTDLPRELDTPALLSLLKYCKEFHPIDLQLVSDILEIRNKVFHSPDLRVGDRDKDSWINNMLSLVSNLNIQREAYADIDKLKTEDISVGFKEQEIKVLQNMVSEVLNDVLAQKGDIDLLMNAQSQHKEEIEKLKETAGDNKEQITGLMMQSQQLQTDLKGQKSQMESYTQVMSALITFLDNNPDLPSIKLSEELEASSIKIQESQTRLQTVESQLQDIKGELSLMKSDQEKLRMDQETMKTEIMTKNQDIKGEMTAMKGEMTAMKTEISTVKGDQELLRMNQEAMKTEIMAEYQELKGEHEILRNQIEQISTCNKGYLEQVETEKQTGSSNMELMRNPVQISDPVQELSDKFDSILKFIASKPDGVQAKDVSQKCKLGVSSKSANPLLYFLREKEALVYEQVERSQKRNWKLGQNRPSEQELRVYAAEKLAKGKR